MLGEIWKEGEGAGWWVMEGRKEAFRGRVFPLLILPRVFAVGEDAIFDFQLKHR